VVVDGVEQHQRVAGDLKHVDESEHKRHDGDDKKEMRS
jgi:hypothetical protein